ncbi:MAG: MFS transporter [Candidatus Woesearchaeota archaeon]|nr:MFS transporter [Candidatus Woesearchaeota archaeon]
MNGLGIKDSGKASSKETAKLKEDEKKAEIASKLKPVIEEENPENRILITIPKDAIKEHKKGILDRIIPDDGKNNETSKKSLKYSIIEGSANSVMTGFGENYISSFAVKLNATDVQLSFIETFPVLIASFFQLFSVGAIDRIKNRKKIILSGIFAQACTWLLITSIALYFKNPILLLIFFTMEVSFRIFVNPAWSSMMGEIAEEKIRGKYFGIRNKIAGAINFFAMLIAGRVIYLFSINEKKDFVLYGFAILFALSFVARMISWHFMRKIHEKQYIIEEKNKFTLWQFIKNMRMNNFGIFIIFLCIFNFAVYVSSPFFTAYMLKGLGMNFWLYTIVNSATTVVTFLVMSYWGKYSDIFGNRHIFEITGYLTPLVPILFILSPNPYYLFIINAFSGFVWAGFNLSSSNYIYDAVSPQKRVRCLSYYIFLDGIAIFSGALAGGLIMSAIKAPIALPIISLSKYHVIFIVSGLLRLAAVAYFMPKIREVRLGIKEVASEELFVKLIAIEPVKSFFYMTTRNINYGVGKIEEMGKNFIELTELDKIVKKKKKE